MDVSLSELLATFMEAPLVVWVQTMGPLGPCEDVGSEDRLNMFMELVDGVFLHKIMTQIDPSPTNQRLSKNVNNDLSLRLHNLTVLTRHIRTYYQETLKQLIVMPLPDILCIAKDPISVKSMEELRRLLLLILGCSVQCERKEEMIEKIKLLDIHTQAAIVCHIREVTHNQLNVVDLSWLEEGSELAKEELDHLSRNMAASLQQLIKQRDSASEMIVDLTQERDYLSEQQPPEGFISRGLVSPERGQSTPGGQSSPAGLNNGCALIMSEPTKEEKQHLSVELADTKAKLRRYRQELEEKTEQLMDSKHEVERLDQELQRTRQENQSLSSEARSVRVYRDEVDALRERASRVDRLETELSRCKERLNDVHFYKTRVEELREDNMTLVETKVLLEEQLSASRGRCDKMHTLEKENLFLRAKMHDLEMERDSERQRLEELVEENMLLEMGQKQSMNESAHLGWELEQLSKNNDNTNTETRKSLVHELNECVSSRVLKLEKENRELQSSIERLKEEAHVLQEKQLHTQEVDRENQSLSKKLDRLQGLLDQERLTNQDMESLGEDILKEKQILDRQMHALRAEKDKQISELESEKQHLLDAVGSLQERAQSNHVERVREVEAQNQQLQHSITDTSSRLASLETQLKLANEEAKRLREKAGRCEEVEREAARLERSRDALSREVVSLHASSERSEALEKQVSSLEQEVHRLKREAEEAQQEVTRLARHEAESALLSKENLDLRCSLENLRASSARLATLQEEHQEAQRETHELRRSLEEAREDALHQKNRVERLELSMASLNQEKHRLEEQLQSSKEDREEVERQRSDTHTREEELRREVEELSQERERREKMETEQKRLQSDLESSEKGRKQLEKEGWRMRTLLEGKETELEEKARRLALLEKEGTARSKELERLKEGVSRAKELERENKELHKQATIDMRTLATLREELVTEKLSVQQQSVELERLSEEVEKMGLNREKMLQQEHTLEDSKYRLLESRLEETVQQTIKIREEKISALERKVEESKALNATLRDKLTGSALSKQREEEENSQQHSGGWGQGSATAELLRIKDHLIDVEKNNSSLLTESSLLKDQLKQLDNQNTAQNSQMVSLQRHTTTLQEHNSALHTQTAKLQVENSTLASQSASLMAQNAVLQGQVAALETEVESWQRQREEAWRGRESVLSDHERLLSLHDRQAHEYEQLISVHTALKGKLRALEADHRLLDTKHGVLLQQKEQWQGQEGSSRKDKEELNQEIQKTRLLQQENLQLKGEVDRLSVSQSQHQEQSEALQHRLNELKSSLSCAQLEVRRCTAQYDSLMEQHQAQDVSMTKLDNHCELLSRLKGNLEEENHHLLSQVNLLSQQNHTLLERSMESKELYHQEQKLYIDKLNALRRQKEKLEEKIMDQYKFYDPTPKKRSQWSGAKAFAKLIKPRKENSREVLKEKERSKVAPPDIPLPAPPNLLPPETTPPLPLRKPSDSLGPHSPALTPISRGLTDRSQALYRSSTPGGSSESIDGEDGHRQGQTIKALSSTPNHQSSSLDLTNNSTPARLGQGRRPRGPSHEEDSRHITADSVFGQHGSLGGRPGSADYSHHTSSSNSPVNCIDTKDRQARSASLSSDDVIGLSQSQLALSRSSTLPYDHTPNRAQPQRAVGVRSKTRPSSPGSEMVSLEQFLQESNVQSPPMVSTESREDLMADFFTRSSALTVPAGRDQVTPTSYVMPTLHSSNQSPGVKPVGQSPASAQPVTQRSSQSLSRTFSLASADLLHSNGPDSFRGNDGQSDVVVRGPRQGGGANNRRERPLSARLAGPTNQHGDGGVLSPPIHHSSSLNLQTERFAAREKERGRSHHAEVAMVTPVRAVPQEPSEYGEESRERRSGDSSLVKKESSVERPQSTPASPDPNNDPQTVWYEYGCV